MEDGVCKCAKLCTIALEKCYVGSEVLTAVVMSTNTIFWDITPCNLLKLSRRFGRTYASIFRVEKIQTSE
jgi:hypothetical protein